MGRKRCFESLEERRLLADAGGSLATPNPASMIGDSTPAQAAAAASPATPDATPGDSYAGAATQNSSVATDAASSSAATNAASTAAESPNEYASSSSGSTGSDSPATPSYAANDYTAPNSSGQSAGQYANARSYSSATNYSTPYYTPAQTAGLDSLVAALAEQARASQANSPLAPLAPVGPTTSGAASSGGGGAPAGIVGSRPSDLVVRSEMAPPLAVGHPTPAFEQQAGELTVPIALLAPGSPELDYAPTEPEIALDEDRSDESDATTPEFAALVAGPLAANLDRIERGVDALFERLERLGAEWAHGAGPRRFGQALVAAAGAAAAWEYARARRREADAARTPYDWRAPRELQLPRRRLARRRSAP